jgi:hypothetical protein
MELTPAEGYSKILKLLKKYKDVCIFDVDDLERTSKIHLFAIKLKEEYGFNINPKRINSLDYNKLGDYDMIAVFGESRGRTISWEDNGAQPKEDELLYRLNFSTGPYIFGEDYPIELFQKMFNELKTYGPKYVDSTNRTLYFSMDNASKIFNVFNSIISKYHDINKEDFKIRKIKRLKEDLERLENNK